MKKNIFIMGDSYSTYGGYIPEGYNCYYSDERTDEPIVKSVEKTWWKRLAAKMDYNIAMNDSFSGSTVCNTVRENHNISSSFVSRIDKYIDENFFAENKIDEFFLFGGTNDSWTEAPLGELKYENWTADDLKCVLPAFCYIMDKLKNTIKVPHVTVIINTNLNEVISEGIKTACQKYGFLYAELKNIDKANGHPTELGMEQIADQVADCLK